MRLANRRLANTLSNPRPKSGITAIQGRARPRDPICSGVRDALSWLAACHVVGLAQSGANFIRERSRTFPSKVCR